MEWKKVHLRGDELKRHNAKIERFTQEALLMAGTAATAAAVGVSANKGRGLRAEVEGAVESAAEAVLTEAGNSLKKTAEQIGAEAKAAELAKLAAEKTVTAEEPPEAKAPQARQPKTSNQGRAGQPPKSSSQSRSQTQSRSRTRSGATTAKSSPKTD
ncbi:hypothetical protein FACS1894120_1350 [Clostridia bacterium]|nr:hypothetical protein FACS1894120_1350 [Clostridia bacterium]